MSEGGRTVAITGAGGTLGSELSQPVRGRTRHRRRAERRQRSLEATVNGLPERRGAVETLRADVSEVAEVEAVVASRWTASAGSTC